MALSLRPDRVKRYKDLAVLLVKHGRMDWVTAASLDDLSNGQANEASTADQAEAFASDLEALGPTYVKLGQLLSGRPDLLPAKYIDALKRLQDNVAPFEFAQVVDTIEAELNVRLSTAFDTFDEQPLASASLGQVHRARLRDGRDVVVKVLRPGIRDSIRDDLAALSDIAALLDENTEAGRRYAFSDLLNTFRSTLLRELDYRREAGSLRTLAKNLAEYPSLVVPEPVDDYTTPSVLTMDYVSGTKLTDISPVVMVDVDGTLLATQLFKAYLDSILLHGFFHADPHPGNVLLTRDRQLALIDLGMVGYVDPDRRFDLLNLIFAVSEGRGRDAGRLGLRLGSQADDADPETFIKEVSERVLTYQDSVVEQKRMGTLVMDLIQISGNCGVRPAQELTMIGKTFLNLDEITRTLDPNFDLNLQVREHGEELTKRHMLGSITPGRAFASMAGAAELMHKAPERLGRILDALADNQFEIKVNSFDETRLTHNLQKIANRISTGIVLAALIIGAAMLMRVETGFTLFGYPGLAMVLFLMAVAAGFWLVVSIAMKDRDK